MPRSLLLYLPCSSSVRSADMDPIPGPRGLPLIGLTQAEVGFYGKYRETLVVLAIQRGHGGNNYEEPMMEGANRRSVDVCT